MRQNGEGSKAEPLVPAPVEPSAEEGATAKKSKKRKVAEAQAVQAQAAEAANGAPGVPHICLLLIVIESHSFLSLTAPHTRLSGLIFVLISSEGN